MSVQRMIEFGKYIEELKASGWSPRPVELNDHRDLLARMLSDGGVVCGGAAVAGYLKVPRVGDIDVYFKDPAKFAQYYCWTEGIGLDVCLYVDEPWEFHDISASEVALDPESDSMWRLSERARLTFETNEIRVNFQNLLAPEKSARRIIKYCGRYGLKCNQADWVCLCAWCGLEKLQNELAF